MKLTDKTGHFLLSKNKISSFITNSLALCAIVTTVGLTSCDPLGVEPTDKVFEEQFWTNAQLSRAFVYKFYTWAPATANDAFTAEQWSDNAIGNDETDWSTFRQTSFCQRSYDALNGIDGFTAPWGEQYKKIRATNLGIERIPTVPSIQESVMNQLLAECYFFRGWLYFEMEQYWGGVPYIDRVMNVFDETMLPRIGREELFDKILADFDKSIEYFGKTEETPQLGLVNVDAVQAIKSRVALYAACASDAAKNRTYENLSGTEESKALFRFQKNAEHYYQIAYDAAKGVIGKYKLENNYSKLFNSADGYTSSEAIWPVMFNKDNRSGFNVAKNHAPVGKYYGSTTDFNKDWGIRGSAYPTQDLVDCYYQKDEADGKWKQWWKTKQATVDMNGSVDAEGNYKAETENYNKMYENRDERFYATVLYDGSYYAGIEKEMYLIGTWVDLSEPTKSEKYSALHTGFRDSEKLNMPVKYASSNTITSYYPAKYIQGHFKEDGTLETEQANAYYFMVRYAEVLMNYAEAAIKLNKPNEARDAINQIRNRAGLDNFDESVVGHDLWEEYKLQRRIEFAYEVPSHRYYDLLRWSEAEGKTVIDELNRGPKGLLIFRKGIESDKIGENGYPAPKTDPKYFTPRIETRRFDYNRYEKVFNKANYYKLPFTQTILESEKALVQNPGW